MHDMTHLTGVTERTKTMFEKCKVDSPLKNGSTSCLQFWVHIVN